MYDVQVVELRVQGLSFREIAAELDISASGARKALTRALAEITEQITEGAEAYRSLELTRLEKVSEILWPGVQEGDLQTIDRWLKVRESARKLTNLDLREEASGGEVHWHIETRRPDQREGYRPPPDIDLEPADVRELPAGTPSADVEPVAAQAPRDESELPEAP